MKKLLIFLLLIPIVYAITISSPAVFNPVPRSMSLYQGDQGQFIMNLDNTKSGSDAYCSFSEEGGESVFLMNLNPGKIDIEAGGIDKVIIDVTIPEDLAPGRYMEKICANCGVSKEICTSCKTTTSCDYIVDVVVLEREETEEDDTEKMELPESTIVDAECYRDTDCGSLTYCPDGTNYKEWVCLSNKCQAVYYADDPCGQQQGFFLERLSSFFRNFLDLFFIQ